MDTLVQVLASGITLGSLYAVSSIALSLLWGGLNLLNLAQGAMLTLGGYIAYLGMTTFGLYIPLSIGLAILAGASAGLVMYFLLVKTMIGSEGFETNIIIATFGFALLLENLVQNYFGAYPLKQPIGVEGGFNYGTAYIKWQSGVLLFSSCFVMGLIGFMLQKTRLGRAIRAAAVNKEIASLQGVNVSNVYIYVLAICGGLSAISGIMVSTITTLAPTMGYDPMLKAFIVCVIAGLGNVYGALVCAMFLGVFEAGVQYLFGVRYGFPALLILVILTLIWRPNGVFGFTSSNRV